MSSITISLMLLGLFSTLSDYALAISQCGTNISAFPPDPKSGCCGFSAAVEAKFFGGEGTTIDQYPWLVLIEYLRNDKLTASCGGTLISSKYVLTAAHCVSGSITKIHIPKNIILGEYDTSHDGPDCVMTEGSHEDCSDGAVKIPIEKIVLHPQYDEINKSRWNDIALVRMTKMAPYTDFIRPICLPTSDISIMKNPVEWLKFAAWGTPLRRSPVKLQVSFPFVPQEKCQVVYSSQNVDLWKGQLCAGGEKDKDSCRGDGGLPLMNDNYDRQYEVVGLVSFGSKPCGAENIPSVYTNVYEYKSWVMDNIAA